VLPNETGVAYGSEVWYNGCVRRFGLSHMESIMDKKQMERVEGMFKSLHGTDGALIIITVINDEIDVAALNVTAEQLAGVGMSLIDRAKELDGDPQ
jgi:hypothetical protein